MIIPQTPAVKGYPNVPENWLNRQTDKIDMGFNLDIERMF
jgi:hypothetical protein